MSGGARCACPDELLLVMLEDCGEQQLTCDNYAVVACKYGYSGGFLRDKHLRALAGEEVFPRPRGGAHNVVMDDDLDEMLLELCKRTPDAYLRELQSDLLVVTGQLISATSIWRALVRTGLSLKKKTRIPAAKFSPFNVAWHARYTEAMSHRRSDTVHFFDETMVSSRDAQGRTRQWAPRGQPAQSAEAPTLGYKISCAALISTRPGAPPLVYREYNDTTRGEDVAEFFCRMLMDTEILKAGDTVVMDNAATHCGGNSLLIRAMLGKFSVDLVFLPPYSPERKPIELAFAKFKRLLREHLSGRHTRAQVFEALPVVFAQITADDVRSYYRHCHMTS